MPRVEQCTKSKPLCVLWSRSFNCGVVEGAYTLAAEENTKCLRTEEAASGREGTWLTPAGRVVEQERSWNGPILEYVQGGSGCRP